MKNLKKPSLKLVVLLVQNSTEYGCKQVDIIIENDNLVLRSLKKQGGYNETLHCTDLIGLISQISNTSCFVQYNNTLNICELLIF